jgi:hypothetical protein
MVLPQTASAVAAMSPFQSVTLDLRDEQRIESDVRELSGVPQVAISRDQGNDGKQAAELKQLPQPHEQEDNAVRSKRARATKRAQLDTVKGRIMPVMENAASGARDRSVLVAERVGPAVQTAVGTARDKAAPVVADVRDRVVDDVLPRLAAGVAAASVAAASARDHAVESSNSAFANLPANKKKAKRRARRRRFLFLTIAFAAIAAGISAAKARSKQEDPWTTGSSTGATNGTPAFTSAPVTPEPAPAPTVGGLPVAEPTVTGDPLTDPRIEEAAEDSTSSVHHQER